MLELYHSAGGVLEALLALVPPHTPEIPTSQIACNIRYSAHTSLALSSLGQYHISSHTNKYPFSQHFRLFDWDSDSACACLEAART